MKYRRVTEKTLPSHPVPSIQSVTPVHSVYFWYFMWTKQIRRNLLLSHLKFYTHSTVDLSHKLFHLGLYRAFSVGFHGCIVQRHCNLVNQHLFAGRLGCFQSLAVANNMEMNHFLHTPFVTYASILEANCCIKAVGTQAWDRTHLGLNPSSACCSTVVSDTWL